MDTTPNTGFRTVIGPNRQQEEQSRFGLLFPNWRAHDSRAKLFAHLQDGLVQMAQNGTLSVTAIHNQPKPLPDFCGMIILGQRFEEGSNKQKNEPNLVPMQLRNYQVKVKALGPKGIGWKLGRAPAGTYRSDLGGGQTVFEDVYTESDMREVELPLDQAWTCLHQAGKDCTSAKSKRLQDRDWLYEEVMPEQKADPIIDTPEEHPPHLSKTRKKK